MFYFLVMDSSSCSGPAPAYKCQEHRRPGDLSSPALCQAPGCEFPAGPEVPGPLMRLGPLRPVVAGSSQAAGPFESGVSPERAPAGRSRGLRSRRDNRSLFGGLRLAGPCPSALSPCQACAKPGPGFPLPAGSRALGEGPRRTRYSRSRALAVVQEAHAGLQGTRTTWARLSAG